MRTVKEALSWWHMRGHASSNWRPSTCHHTVASEHMPSRGGI